MNYPKVTIYSLPTCSYCKLAKDYLIKRKIAFTDVNVDHNEAAQTEMIAKSGQYSVPVIDVDGQIIIGFQKNTLGTILNL